MSNSLCRDVGHDWQWTTSTTFRKCHRTGCKATERLVRNQWVPVATVVKKEDAPIEPIQGVMFQ